MKVIAIKTSKKKIILGMSVFLLILAGTIGAVAAGKTVHETAQAGLVLTAETADQRIAFLESFGWKVKSDPVEVKEVVIPDEFNDVYTNYNQIQKKQDFDLEKYKGRRVKRWTYEVTNYKGYENQSCIHANVLVYEGKVIGGDVCSIEVDGFMHGFAKE